FVRLASSCDRRYRTIRCRGEPSCWYVSHCTIDFWGGQCRTTLPSVIRVRPHSNHEDEDGWNSSVVGFFAGFYLFGLLFSIT
ncbi:hypothetical protein JAAARDRAFT_207718, partial [Jaapia argillacea MUCL 33604]